MRTVWKPGKSGDGKKMIMKVSGIALSAALLSAISSSVYAQDKITTPALGFWGVGADFSQIRDLRMSPFARGSDFALGLGLDLEPEMRIDRPARPSKAQFNTNGISSSKRPASRPDSILQIGEIAASSAPSVSLIEPATLTQPEIDAVEEAIPDEIRRPVIPGDGTARILADAEPADMVPGSLPVIVIPPLTTSDITLAGFSGAREKALELMNADPDDVAAALDYARTLLGGMFLQEAYGIIDEISSRQGPGGASDEIMTASIAQAIASLGGPRHAAASNLVGAEWQDGRFWPVLDRIARNVRVDDMSDIRGAAAALEDQSSAVAGAALPMLFGAALVRKDAKLAEDLLLAGLNGTDLSGTSRFILMQGQLAEMKGEPETAFDFYSAAMANNDLAGAEARVALADMALNRKVRNSLPQIREILTIGVDQWQGDKVALQLLTRLAGVSEALADAPEALRVMAKIRADYPGTRESQLAERRIPMILSSYARQAREGSIDIETYITALRKLEPVLNWTAEWVPARMILADRLSKAGLNKAAAAEYRAIRENVRELDSPAPKNLMEEVVLLEIEMHIAAGDLETARTLINQPMPEDPILAKRQATAALILAYPQTGANVPGAAMGEILEQGRAAFRGQDYAKAVSTYDVAINAGEGLHREDLARYFHAKALIEKNGNMDPAARRLDETAIAGLLPAAETLSLSGQSGSEKLSTDSARDLLARSKKALDAVNEIISTEQDANPASIVTP